MSQVYNLAQSFFVDAETVKGAARVGISTIELFFKQKPNTVTNKSGIVDPGVSVIICAVDADKKPIIEQIVSGTYFFARAEYADIMTSANASVGTKFKFDIPILVETNREYAFLVKFDGNEDFILWTSKQGDTLVGTNQISPGPSGKYVGNYYTKYVIGANTASANAPNPDWKFLSDTDLKFKVYAARYAVEGTPVSSSSFSANVPIYSADTSGQVSISAVSGQTTFEITTGKYEYITFEKKISKPKVRGGELVYQDGPFFPGGSANGISLSVSRNSDLITANANYPNGATFSWNDVFGNSTEPEYIVVVEANTSGGVIIDRKTDIRKVVSIVSNTVLQVDENLNFSNNNVFFRKSPVGRVDFIDKTKAFDVAFKIDGTQKKKRTQDVLILKDSTANASVRFVNNTILTVNTTAAGGGYNNTDYLAIFGYESGTYVKGGYKALANIVTNASGNISAVYVSNSGAGFVNTGNLIFVISNSSVSPSTLTNTSPNSTINVSATGAIFEVVVGSVLRGEFDGDDGISGYFANCEVINPEISDINPSLSMNNLAGTEYTLYYQNPYYMMQEPSTYLGVAYRIAADRTANMKIIKENTNNILNYKNIPVMASRSNQFIIVDDGNSGNPNTSPPAGTGTLKIVAAGNNDFTCVRPGSVSITHSKMNINNDYTGEDKNNGNADSKHITTKINFANGRFAEDLLVYLTAYRPLNTDIKVFARIHNSKDPEAFDDKDWTLLDIIDGDIYSSSANPDDYIEMTFGFPQSPNVAISLAGTANVENTTTTNVIGFGTTWSSNATANLQPNDLVKIYSPLFPDTVALAVIDTVVSDTKFSIKKPITNTTINGTGLTVELIGRVGNSTVANVGYPMQAFNNILNDNVVRYFSSSMAEYDTYDSMQLKIVLLADLDQVSNNDPASIPTTYPRVDDIRALGVTA